MLSDVDLLDRLVAFDSTSANSNVPIADFICEYAAVDGVSVERLPSPDGDKVNLVLRTGPPPAADRAGLILSGHMDVVPAVEPGWTSDPFALRRADGRLYARGACDMKGFDALALNALVGAAARGGLAAPLVVVLTYDEEVGTVGARDFVRHGPDPATLPRRAIIGEPTSLRVVRMHKGHLKARVTIRGVGAHSGYPHLGRNAIEAMGRVIAAMRGLRRKLEDSGGPNAEHFPETPYVTLNLGVIAGGAAINIVPDRCDLDLGLRLLPGMDRDGMVALLRQQVQGAAGEDAWEVRVTGESPPLLLDETSDLYAALCGLVDQTDTVSASYATDGGWLATAGIDCAVWGPGSIAVAHKPDEYMPENEYARGKELLARAVERFCG